MTRPSPSLRFLTLVTLVSLTSPSALAQDPPSQAYFLSIDCGAPVNYTDTITGLNWVTDDSYTSVGTNAGAVPGAPSTVNYTEMKTLRYFKDARQKFCYELPVQSNQTYLVGATFWYGNYDGLSKPPVFNMAIDATSMVPIDLTASVWSTQIMRQEYVKRVGVAQTTMSMCFYQDPTSLTTPFVSSITLRLLQPLAYDVPWIDQGNFLFAFVRQNFGGETEIRYPDDEYDRVWRPRSVDGTRVLSTTASVDEGGYAYGLPENVLQTAVTPTLRSNLVLSYPYGGSTVGTHFQCVLYMLLAEINPNATSFSRAFTINVPSDIPNPDRTVNIFAAAGGINMGYGMVWKNFSMSNSSAVTLALTDPPTVDGPLVNGVEVLIKLPASVNTTNAGDASALASIKKALSLNGWSGDPCLPVPYDWVTCEQKDSPRVLTVTLNGYNLTGQIPADFSLLTALTSLQLANNSLDGSIPPALANLPALTVLNLYGNNLTGTVPTGLQRPGLSLDIRDNPVCNCAPSPSVTPSASPKKTEKSSNTGLIAGVAGGIVAAAVLATLLVVFCVCKRRRNNATADKLSELPNYQASSGGTVKSNGSAGMPNGSVQGAKAYSLTEVTSATQNFNKKIGEGGFGPVYYGKLAGREVAVKVSDASSRQGFNEFNNEVQLLSRVHHKNLVSLVGYCLDSKNQMLVYEFLHRGTVREHLYGSRLAQQEPLDWNMRLDIALNSAQGLEYLHSGCTPPIIHRDVKSSNILLTDKYVAKVADFGLSRLGPEDGQASHVSTMVKGTAGYLDPEYFSTNNLTEKSDVFSFGVVLLELLCGRQPIDNSLTDRNDWNINEKVRRALQSSDIDRVLDPVVKSCHPNMDSVWKVAEVAIQSVEPKGAHRPFMRDVVRELREAIVLQTGMSATYSDVSSNGEHKSRPSPRGRDYSSAGDPSIDQYAMGPQVR